ncbi:hypothetical protein HHK36_020846 [Tetracentron sinense]|uniref:Transmembrane protein n=1 Tax=Tetracentron sinense TaxID=13715 RepID=A0A834YUP8_TETSI|nr:hypothetical protein HHK36_020846 [Tetracentron sinense]
MTLEASHRILAEGAWKKFSIPHGRSHKRERRELQLKCMLYVVMCYYAVIMHSFVGLILAATGHWKHFLTSIRIEVDMEFVSLERP